MKKYIYNKNNKCVICKKLITNYAKKCKSCSNKKPSLRKGKYWKFNKQQIKNISQLYLKGYSAEDLAKKYYSNVITILQYLKRNDIKIRSCQHSQKTKDKIRYKLFNRKTKIDILNAILSGEICSWKRWKKFRLKILKRDNHKCQICGKKGKVVHHKKCGKKYPKLYFRKSNVITMCRKCHRNIHKTNIFNEYKKRLSILEKEIKKWKSLSLEDPLTLLFNDRKLKRDIKRLCYDYKRYKHRFVAILLDIDHFKRINDTKGHLEGDKVLIRVAKAIKSSIRETDRAYRPSGDEFVILLPHSNIKSANKVIKRINETCNQKLSYGIGTGKKPKQLLKEIDKRMYENKRSKK